MLPQGPTALAQKPECAEESSATKVPRVPPGMGDGQTASHSEKVEAKEVSRPTAQGDRGARKGSLPSSLRCLLHS